MICFRELIQNPKYGFMKKGFITKNQAAIDQLFATKLVQFRDFLPRSAANKQMNQDQNK